MEAASIAQASLLRNLAIEKADLSDASRQELLAFLSGSQEQGYVPQSGEIIGILKVFIFFFGVFFFGGGAVSRSFDRQMQKCWL